MKSGRRAWAGMGDDLISPAGVRARIVFRRRLHMKFAIRSYLLLNHILLSSSLAATPSLTIYNQDFAIVRDTIPLDLQAGVNDVRFSDATVHVQPNSVILRDPTGKHSFQILEQNFQADPISQALLLNRYEGKELE